MLFIIYSAVGTTVFREMRVSKARNVYYYKQNTPFVSSFSDGRFALAWAYINTSDYMIKGISMNLFEASEGDCFNLQAYSGKTLSSQIFAELQTTSPIMIKQVPKFGTLVDSDGKEVNTLSLLYSPNDIYYKTNTYNNDSLYYVMTEGEKPCRVDIAMCYSSCESCSEVGDPVGHHCDSCLTSEGFYPLTDAPSQCFYKTDIINNDMYLIRTRRHLYTMVDEMSLMWVEVQLSL
jgi:hypothetical protein